MTDKEKLIYDYITDTIRHDGFAPSVRDIKEALGIKSTSTVHSYLERLEKKGYITRESGKSRTLRVETIADQPKRTAKIPILSHIKFGTPVLAVENFGSYIDFPLLNNTYKPNTLFAVKMKDDSMKHVGILTDDIVVFKKENQAKNDDLAAVFYNGEIVIRKYFAETDKQIVRLHYDGDYTLSDEYDVFVLGTVVSVLRFY